MITNGHPVFEMVDFLQMYLNSPDFQTHSSTTETNSRKHKRICPWIQQRYCRLCWSSTKCN